LFALLCSLCTAELGYFWHISDNHMQRDYQPGSDPDYYCRDASHRGRAGKFGDYKCMSPYPVEYSAVYTIPTFTPSQYIHGNPMFVLWTGDSVCRHDQFGQSEVTEDLRNITDLLVKLQNNFNEPVPIYPVIGNHDASPQSQVKPEWDWVYGQLANLWSPFLPSACLETLKQYGYYSVNVKTNLRLIVLNTVLYHQENDYTQGISDPGHQIAWLHQELDEARNQNQFVYIAGHVPPRAMSDFRPEYVKPFIKAMQGYNDIIKGSFWGHEHQDRFQLVGDVTAGDFHVGHYAPTLGSYLESNPAFRGYVINTGNYEVITWRTFYMDLVEANRVGKIKWDILYDAKALYGISNASAPCMLNLVQKMRSNSTIWELYYNRLGSGTPMPPCEGDCKKYKICELLFPKSFGFDECVNG